MRYFDLHCDTMTECFLHGKKLRENNLHVSLEKARALEAYGQCFAAWIPDDLRGEAAYQRFCGIADRLGMEAAENEKDMAVCRGPGDLTEARKQKKCGAVLTVEKRCGSGRTAGKHTGIPGTGCKDVHLDMEWGKRVGPGRDGRGLCGAYGVWSAGGAGV